MAYFGPQFEDLQFIMVGQAWQRNKKLLVMLHPERKQREMMLYSDYLYSA